MGQPRLLLQKCLVIALLVTTGAWQSQAQERAAWLKQARFGVMTHYLQDWLSKTENKTIGVPEWNSLIDQFNVNELADQVKSVGASYMIFTIGQNAGYFVSPNAAYDNIVGIRPSKCARRDLIADLATALHTRGIKLIVYLPSGAPNGDSLAKNALQWKNGPYPNKEFQANWEHIISEWSLRWRDKVDGWWFDGCYWPNIMYRTGTVPGFKTFADAARAGNPNSMVAFNPGVTYRLISVTPYADYVAGEIDKPAQLSIRRNYDGKIDNEQVHVLSFLGEKWGMGAPRFTTEQVIGFMKPVLDAGGAMTWDVPIQSNGHIYPPFIEQLTAIGKAINDKK